MMADDIQEAEDITAIASGLNINIGTLNQRTIPAMFAAGKKANALGCPALLDPVGAGASTLRTQTALDLIEGIQFTAIRGNSSEIKALAAGSSTTKGVDADLGDAVTEATLDTSIAFAKSLAARLNTIVIITGPIDLVADESHC